MRHPIHSGKSPSMRRMCRQHFCSASWHDACVHLSPAVPLYSSPPFVQTLSFCAHWVHYHTFLPCGDKLYKHLPSLYVTFSPLHACVPACGVARVHILTDRLFTPGVREALFTEPQGREGKVLPSDRRGSSHKGADGLARLQSLLNNSQSTARSQPTL